MIFVNEMVVFFLFCSFAAHHRMRALGGITLLLAVAICQGYETYQRSSFRSSSSSSYGGGQTVPQLNSFASAHFNEVRELANQLKQKFNVLSQGSTNFAYTSPWSGEFKLNSRGYKTIKIII